jgi:hypothetical protein
VISTAANSSSFKVNTQSVRLLFRPPPNDLTKATGNVSKGLAGGGGLPGNDARADRFGSREGHGADEDEG